MFYKNKKNLVLVITLFTASLFSGCDTHKDERVSLLKQKNEVESQIVSLKSQHTQMSQNIESLSSEINSQMQNLQESIKRHTKLQDSLSEYILEHKMATVAVIAAGGGAASVLDKNLDDDTKSVLAVIGIVGAIYCFSNYEECADVTSKILYYGTQIDAEEKAVGKLKTDITSNKTLLEKNKQSFAYLCKSIDEKLMQNNSLQEKHDSLLCKFCF